MKTSKIKYAGELRTECTHLKSGKTFVTDAPTDNNGKGEAFSPTDTVATALGCCMITIMGIVAEKNNFELGHCKADITKVMESNPRRIGEVIVELHLAEGNFSAEQKKILETAALNCPVAKSLHPDLKQTVTFKY